MRDIRFLTEEIGVRLAGSDSEWQAAKYLEKRFLEYVPICRMEEFPVLERCVESEELEIRIHEIKEKFACSLFSSASSTQGKTITAELVFFDGHTEYQRPDLSHLTGKAVVHFGAHVMNENNYRRLMEARPAFLLMVDTRHPGNFPVADGLFPKFVKKYGAVPTVSVAFYDVWNWMTNGADLAALNVKGDARKSVSCNVIAEIPGEDDGCVYVGAHHDTQAGTVGADDNAVGCAILLELAGILSQTPHKHTIRFISFGAEEQLSVGSATYVRTHRKELKDHGRFMCNFDSCGTAVGWNYFITTTGKAGRQHMRDIYNSRDIYYQECTDLEPFQDGFPFTAAGLPGITLERGNNDCGLFYHHRFDNTADKISPEIVASLADASAVLIQEAADGDPAWCAAPKDPKHLQAVKQCWTSIFGGWTQRRNRGIR